MLGLMWGYVDGENNKNDSIPIENILHWSFFYCLHADFVKQYQRYVFDFIL